MILTIWKPVLGRVKNTRPILRYESIDIEIFLKNKNKGYKVIYSCDTCGDISNTTSHSLFRNTWNGINSQMCRKCRGRKSEEYNFIKWDIIKKSFNGNRYKLITKENEYTSANNRSQFKLKSTCKNGHDYSCTWNNWMKNKRCRICYEKNKFDNAVKYKDGWDLYYFIVWKYTEKNYKQFKNIINPNNLKRSIGHYHLDHRFSVAEGFKLGILPEIIGSVKNLEMLNHSNNISKGTKCSIAIEELFNL
jgi:hypothetical protein